MADDGTIEARLYGQDVGDNISMDTRGSRLVQRYRKLCASNYNFQTMWQELATYIMPHRANITVRRSKGEKQTEKLFDSTAIHANEILAASMQGTITSPAAKWFSLKFRDRRINLVPEVAAWLEQVGEILRLAVNQSNFNSESHEFYLDLGCFATAAIYLEEDRNDLPGFKGLLFRAMPVGGYVIEENAEGRVDTFFRTFKLSIRAIVQKWGLDAVSQSVRERFMTDPDDEIVILHAVFPRTRTKKPAALATPNLKLPFASVYVEMKTKHTLSEGGYHEFPYMVSRWSKTPGEVYGRGPGYTALPDIKTLNKLIELKLKALAKYVDPPMQVLDDGVIGTISLKPAAANVVRMKDAVTPIQRDSRFDIVTMEEEKLMKKIQQIYFVEQLLHLMSRERPAITATEAQIKLQMIQSLIGPTYGRIESEYLNPLIDRAFGLMLRAGVIPPMPPVLEDYVFRFGGKMDVQFEGPLAKAQRNQEFFAIQRTLEVVGAVAQYDPTIVDIVRSETIVKNSADISGATMDIFRTDEEVNAIRQNRADREQAAAQAAQAEQMAKAAGATAPLLKVLQGGAQPGVGGV